MIFVTVGHAPYAFNRMRDRIGSFVRSTWAPHNAVLYIQSGSTTWPGGNNALTRNEQIEAIQRAEVVITHCGAGTLLECWQAGHKPIVLPRRAQYGEHVNDHQYELYEALLAKDMIFPLPDDDAEFRMMIDKATSGWPWEIMMIRSANIIRQMLDGISV